MANDNGATPTRTKKKAKVPKVPRVTFAVTALDDPDYIRLCATPDGQRAFGLFLAMLLAARTAGNLGVFQVESSVMAMLVRWPLPDFETAMDVLTKHGKDASWVVSTETGFEIPNYDKWQTNPNWGGSRAGAGRPRVENPPVTDPPAKSKQQSRNQPPELEKPTRFPPRARARARTRGREVNGENPAGARASKPSADPLPSPPPFGNNPESPTPSTEPPIAAACLALLEADAQAANPAYTPLWTGKQRKSALDVLCLLEWEPEYVETTLLPALRAKEPGWRNPAQLLAADRQGEVIAFGVEKRAVGRNFRDSRRLAASPASEPEPEPLDPEAQADLDALIRRMGPSE